ncbi:MAG: methyltransferase [Armatimonadetes bacterium]|nr:methyltransferase [Armatimonadota bacterium]
MAQSALTHRERFALSLAHQPVDRPPLDLGATDMTEIEGGPRRLASLLGLPEDDEAVLRRLGVDMRGVGGILTPEGTGACRLSATEVVDAWGIRHQWQGHHYEMVGRPLADAAVADLDRFPWPDPERIDRAAIDRLRERARYLYEETPYVVCGRHPYFGVLELGCWMCGYDEFLYRLAGEPEFTQRFFEIVLTYQKKVDAIYYGALGPYLHLTTSGDDFGTQTGPLVSPRMFAEQIAPYLAERIPHIATYTDAVFFHHTCGAVSELIPDLLAAGVRILNPIQPRATGMEPERLKQAFGDRLTFYGGIDTQDLLPNGTPEQVRAETQRVAKVLGADGGYILSAAHTIGADVPLENVLAMYSAVTGR